MPTNLSDLSRLSPVEKLRLIESLWEELAADPSSVPVEDWHREELDRRDAAARSTPDAGSPWDEVRARIAGRHGS
ncbi:MAG TPA: addiction module protein [Planctomycetaceae bacterium]